MTSFNELREKMYVPEKWQLTDKAQIDRFLQENGFATLVSPSLSSSRLPLYFDQMHNKLIGHFARTNKHWQEVDGQTALAIFDGAHSYISPTWYDSRPAVPTWNYVSVHVRGTMRLLDNEQTHHGLNLLLEKYEPSLLVERNIVSNDYQQKLSKGIVGFEMTIEHIDAKAKLGQHRSNDDQLGVVNGLKAVNRPESVALLSLMQTLQIGLGE